MAPIKTAVVGVGYLGKFHAQKYAALPTSKLIAVCDNNIETATTIADELNVRALDSLPALLPEIDALSIVVPTQLHYDIAKQCLIAGKHILLEKPMTTTLEQARELIALADEHQCILQIGHLERFNPAILALQDTLQHPLFIESQRIAPFNPRGADVNVILDLMIHDIDIILDIVNSEVTNIDAKGVAVLSKDIDIANVRLQFENGCVANVTASRAGMKSERKMRVFQHDTYVSVDFQNKKVGIHRKGDGEQFPGVANIESKELEFDQGDALNSEIESFLNCITNNKKPKVDGVSGARALQTAIEITLLLNEAK
ncbi:Oxidoreductase, Gfo/Idh/MocA family [hydrothermal vent metagenome]|uniref:Oxidoreductase, Gfo/Idh/MocA family n=1 Tax=hydrothermal vent metagenome TaxID=652676 RepID=A0A3B1B189_9ZZZZ